MMDSNQSPPGASQQQQHPQQQPTPLRRRGLGLARPTRGQPTTTDATPNPTAAAAVSRAPHGSNERVLNKIARSQLSYALDASASTSASASEVEGWLGTQLFPKLNTGDSFTDDQCAECCCNGTGTAGGSACSAGHGGKRFTTNENCRVRARPVSWGARPSGERRGWLGIWPGGVGEDDCWGDGDGYVTLRPFPSIAEVSTVTTADGAEGASDGSGSENGNGNGSSLVVQQAGAAQSSTSMGQGISCSPAPISRADRFLQVFTRLQPARRALNLHESPPPSPKAMPMPKPKPKESEARCAEVEGAGSRSRSRVAAGDGDVDRGDAGDGDHGGKQNAVSPGLKGSMTACPAARFGEGEAKAGAGATSGSCEVGGVGKLTTPVPKRTALRTLKLPSAGVGSAVDQLSSANVNIVPDRSRAAASSCSSSTHCNSLGPPSTSLDSSVTNVKDGQKGPPAPPSSTPAAPPTSQVEVENPRRVGGLTSTPTANSKASAKQKLLPETAASAPPTSTSHLSRAMSVENVAPDVSNRPKPVAVARTQLKTPARGGGGLAPRNGKSGDSGRMIGRLAGASVTVQRTSRDHEPRKGADAVISTPASTADAAPVSGRRGAPRSRGALACRASSGLLRSTGSAPASASLSGVAEPKLAPATTATGGFVEPCASDASQQEQDQAQEGCQGRKADVPQKVRECSTSSTWYLGSCSVLPRTSTLICFN